MKATDFILNLIFPKRCLFCNSVLGFSAQCDCKAALSAITLDFDNEIDKSDTELRFINKAYALYEYKAPVNASIISMKYNGRCEKALEYGVLLGGKIKSCKIMEEFDIIISVPSSKKSLKKRGYDVPRLIAKKISVETLKPYFSDILIKVFDTEKQSHLSGVQRRANLAGAFSVQSPGRLLGKRVLLTDDVLTTGTTLNECAKALLYAGAENVISVCIAVALNKTD